MIFFSSFRVAPLAQEFGNLPATTRVAPLAQPLAQEFGNQKVTPCVAQLVGTFGRLVWPNWFKNLVRELLSVAVSWCQLEALVRHATGT